MNLKPYSLQTKPHIYRSGGIWHCKFVFDGFGFNPTAAYEQWKRNETFHQDARTITISERLFGLWGR